MKFTFQSGDIQMDKSQTTVNIDEYLHSNLVIFKSKEYTPLDNSKILFTFQSGDIQIIFPPHSVAKVSNLHSNLVIFKSVLNIITYLLILKVLFCRP